MQEIIDVIHKTIYQFFDVCEEGEEMPLTDKDKLLLTVNKAICNNLKVLEPKTGHWIDINGIYAKCSNCNEEIYITGDYKYCPNCGAKMEETE